MKYIPKNIKNTGFFLDKPRKCVVYYTCKEVKHLRNRIRELTGVVRELNKLFDQLIKLAWKIASLAGVILFIIYSLTH